MLQIGICLLEDKTHKLSGHYGFFGTRKIQKQISSVFIKGKPRLTNLTTFYNKLTRSADVGQVVDIFTWIFLRLLTLFPTVSS